MKIKANTPIYRAMEEAFKAVGLKPSKAETVKQMMEYCHLHYPKVVPRVFVGGPGYGNGARGYLRSIGIRFEEDKLPPFINPFTQKVQSRMKKPEMLIEAKARLVLSASGKYSKFNPSIMEDQGIDENFVAELKKLNSKTPIDGVLFDQEAVSFIVKPQKASETDRSDKVFNMDQLVSIGRFVSAVGDSAFAVEASISQDKTGIEITVSFD